MNAQNHCRSEIYEVFVNATSHATKESRPQTIGPFTRPNLTFVLCRDKSGIPTAVYGENRWDFSPYSLAITGSHAIDFNQISQGSPEQIKALRRETKWILFCIIYFTAGGTLGRLSVSSLLIYFRALLTAANFCGKHLKNSALNESTLPFLLSNPFYLAKFVRHVASSMNKSKAMRSLMTRLHHVGPKQLGFTLSSKIEFKYDRAYTQHPVIPTRIYLKVINYWHNLLSPFSGNEKSIAALIGEFNDPVYGYSHEKQKTLKGIPQKHFRPTMEMGLETYNLKDIFTDVFSVDTRIRFIFTLGKIQYAIAQLIQLYTGMRSGEVMRLPYDCLQNKRYEVGSNSSNVRRQMVSVISTTTKFAGYREKCTWLAGDPVVNAVKLAQAIARGVAAVIGRQVESLPLFINVNHINSSAIRDVKAFNTKAMTEVKPKLVITQADFDELVASNENSTFQTNTKYEVGAFWPLTSHQYRRSLAFYASSSGFVSLPTLQRQFKQATRDMARYYQHGFENIASIFGFYDETTDEFILPSDHIAYEFQTGVPINKAHQILHEFLNDNEPLFGAAGAYMERQWYASKDKVNIRQVRKDTAKQVKEGSLAFRPTLLGGCVKVGPCDSFMLGDFVKCTSCPEAIIKGSNVFNEIAKLESELENYSKDSGEYQVVSAELRTLKKFQDEKMKKQRG